MTELKPCPFCGKAKPKAEYKSVSAGYNGLDHRVERHTWSIRCNKCNARGPAVGGRVITTCRSLYYDDFGNPKPDLPEWATSDNKLREKAAEMWNSRATQEKGGDAE